MTEEFDAGKCIVRLQAQKAEAEERRRERGTDGGIAEPADEAGFSPAASLARGKVRHLAAEQAPPANNSRDAHKLAAKKKRQGAPRPDKEDVREKIPTLPRAVRREAGKKALAKSKQADGDKPWL